ncbi:MAG TPA: LacI family DNA-binding transcriptional regulator [Nocardioidaceae bacterium]|nr:LacI family DNA-binding transcriptional regulator [Nocardioidaceae bacterium]
MSSSRPTVQRVAAHAGVSVASVSRVLNGLATSPEMVDKVQSAADELGYSPNAMARSLKVRRTEQLAFSVADVGNPVYVDMMRAVEAETRAEGYRLLLSSTGPDPAEVLSLLRGLAHGYADGLILSPIRVTDEIIEALHAISLPTVVIGRIPPDVPVDNVRANSAGGVRMAVEHLYETGRRRIGFLNGPTDTVPGVARARAFGRVCDRLGLPTDDALLAEADDFTIDAGLDAVGDLIARGEPDAVLGGNDLLAVATMQALRERGHAVPDDVAVVGMDDTELATVTAPTLTSVSLGSTRRGQLAAQLLLERLRDPDREPQRVAVQPRLRVRDSSRARSRS